MASSSSRPSQLLKHVFVGSKNDAKQKELLQSLKISHILNCTPTRKMDPEAGCPNYFEKEQTFKYLRIPIFDNKGENLLSHLPTAFKFIEESMHYGGVLIHCHKGVSRSASVAIAYLMMKNKFTVRFLYTHTYIYNIYLYIVHILPVWPVYSASSFFVSLIFRIFSSMHELAQLTSKPTNIFHITIYIHIYISHTP